MTLRIVVDTSKVGFRSEAVLADEAAAALGRPDSNWRSEVAKQYQQICGEPVTVEDLALANLIYGGMNPDDAAFTLVTMCDLEAAIDGIGDWA